MPQIAIFCQNFLQSFLKPNKSFIIQVIISLSPLIGKKIGLARPNTFTQGERSNCEPASAENEPLDRERLNKNSLDLDLTRVASTNLSASARRVEPRPRISRSSSFEPARKTRLPLDRELLLHQNICCEDLRTCILV